jgi:L-cysteine desulfidase
MKPLWKIILWGALFFVFPLILVIVAFQNWCVIKPNFFNYSLGDIISLTSTGYIGIVVMVIFSIISGNSKKRMEIISENITMFQSCLESVLTTFSNNQNSIINENSKAYILRSLRIASNEFSNIYDFLTVEKKDKETLMLLEIVKENLINFKQATTDKPFQKKYKVQESDIQYAMDSHNKLRQNTQRIKMNLYK